MRSGTRYRTVYQMFGNLSVKETCPVPEAEMSAHEHRGADGMVATQRTASPRMRRAPNTIELADWSTLTK